MNSSIRLFFFAAGALAVAGTVCAQENEIYTWTDENGVVHYTDTVPDNPTAVSMEAPEAYFPGSADAYPDDGAADPAQADEPMSDEHSASESPEDTQVSSADGTENEELSYAEQKRRELARNREKRRMVRAERNQKCASARQQIAMLEPNRRVFFTNDEGETERLDDEVRVKKVEEAKAQVTEFCD